MAPEAPGNLVVLDLHFRKDLLVATVDEIKPAKGGFPRGQLRVVWDMPPNSGEYYSVGNGVVHVSHPPGFEMSAGSDATTDSFNELRYAWKHFAQGDGLMLVLVLPKGHTLATAQPMPRSAKVFRGRIAVYFKPAERDGETAKVKWQLQKIEGDLPSEVERLNRDIDTSENVPQHRNSG